MRLPPHIPFDAFYREAEARLVRAIVERATAAEILRKLVEERLIQQIQLATGQRYGASLPLTVRLNWSDGPQDVRIEETAIWDWNSEPRVKVRGFTKKGTLTKRHTWLNLSKLPSFSAPASVKKGGGR